MKEWGPAGLGVRSRVCLTLQLGLEIVEPRGKELERESLNVSSLMVFRVGGVVDW